MLAAMEEDGCYFRVAEALRPQMVLVWQKEYPYQIVFDRRITPSIAEMRDAATGELRGTISNLALTIAAAELQTN